MYIFITYFLGRLCPFVSSLEKLIFLRRAAYSLIVRLLDRLCQMGEDFNNIMAACGVSGVCEGGMMDAVA